MKITPDPKKGSIPVFLQKLCQSQCFDFIRINSGCYAIIHSYARAIFIKNLTPDVHLFQLVIF
jgi:hypothetical protein